MPFPDPLQGGQSRKPRAYERFRGHLLEIGFTLYPEELGCAYSDHPFVDIAAKMGAFYWAFEYKSEGDSISRGVEQVTCYMDWFDYVVLVSEKMLDHRKSENYWKLRKMGAGVWIYDPARNLRIVKAQPTIQAPLAQYRRSVAARFRCSERIRHGNCLFSEGGFQSKDES